MAKDKLLIELNDNNNRKKEIQTSSYLALMSDFATGQGYYLAELIKHYHRLRDNYLEWAGPLFNTRGEAIATYQKSLLAWYESRILRKDPYAGDVMTFLQAATAAYTDTVDEFQEEWAESGMATLGQDPVRYLPRAVRLNNRQQQILSAYVTMDVKIKELLLLAYYHQLSDGRIHEVLQIGHNAQAAAKVRSGYLRQLRDSWRAIGLLDDQVDATPEQQEVIDRYLRGELDVAQRWEVEARKTSEPPFLESLELREDWELGLRLIGRKDTLETLVNEEEVYRPKEKAVATVSKSSGINAGLLQGVLGVILLGVLLYLLYITFAPTSEEELYSEYFRPFPNITRNQDSLSQLTPEQKDLADMLRPYDRRDFLEAYDDLLPAATAYPSAKLYLGVSALALNQPLRAQEWLDQYLPGDAYYAYARWYMALAYLAEGQSNPALRELVEIASVPGHPYELPAIRLIEALE